MRNSENRYRVFENDLSNINRRAVASPKEFIRESEREYRASLTEAACFLERRTGSIRIVMLAGPSSSGKTTTARVLMEILREMGIYSIDAVSYTHLDVYKRQEHRLIRKTGGNTLQIQVLPAEGKRDLFDSVFLRSLENQKIS